MTSPTARTLARLRADGWTAGLVERFNTHAGVRQDLFGFIDVLAITAGQRPLAIQATTAANAAARLAKARALPAQRTWLAAGCRFEVWGWARRGPRGKRKRWTASRFVCRLAGKRLLVDAIGSSPATSPAPIGEEG
jgi:hypothetical protein